MLTDHRICYLAAAERHSVTSTKPSAPPGLERTLQQPHAMAVRLRSTVVSRLADNRKAWLIPHRWAAPLLLIPLVPLPILALGGHLEHPWFYAVTVEDGIVEWVQFVALIAGAVVWGIVAIRWHRLRQHVMAVLIMMVALMAVVVAGEEISWGQRVLGWTTPAGLDAINHQGELNIHNISSIEFVTRIGQFGASAFGVVLPLLALGGRFASRIGAAYLIPPVGLISFFLVPLAYWVIRIQMDPARAMLRFSEVPELSLYAGFAIFGWLSVRRLTETA